MAKKKLDPPEGAQGEAEDRKAPGDPLGERLRDMFKTVEAAPLPDDIRRLVGEMEKNTGRKPRRN